MKHRFTAALERFSRAMLAPLTYLSAAGLLLAAGALLTSTALSGALPLLQWGPVRLMGRILYKCLSAVISNLSVLFCTGLAASLAKQEKHQAAFIALMSYFIYLTAGNVTLAELGLLAQPDGLTGLYGAGAEGAALQRGGAKRLQCADRFRHPCAAGPAGGGAAAGQGGLLTFGGRATIIGKKRLPAQSERNFCVAPIYSRLCDKPCG